MNMVGKVVNIIFRNYVIISFPQTVARNCCTLRLRSSCVFNERCLPYCDRCTNTERKLLTIKKRDYCIDLNGRTKLGNGRTNSVVLGQSVQTLLHTYFNPCTRVFIVFAACARICLLAILLQLLQYIGLSWHTKSIILPKRVAGTQ